MDYEKAYKDALDRARELHGTVAAGRDFLAEIFPELAENEDERIRKWLVDYFGSIKDVVWIHREFTCDQILSWLEKKKVNTEGDFGRGYDCGYQAGYAVAMNEMKPKVATATFDSEKQKEQKPAEWSEEDERILKGIIGKIDHDQSYGVSKADMLDFLKSLRPRKKWKPSEEQMAWLKLAAEEADEPLKSQLAELYKDIRENLIWK